ncbi:hypothetical protein ABK040_001247 [Willaertia magna]
MSKLQVMVHNLFQGDKGAKIKELLQEDVRKVKQIDKAGRYDKQDKKVIILEENEHRTNEYNNVYQIIFTNSYTENGVREITKKILDKAKVVFVETKLNISEVDSSYDETKYWKV